ncbi:futalosine hydrolase [Lewinella sp. LCG006]|uniref:futalosine hydrolase n=1 Tax=Lewinella sp. LCG006 TaxID=3231911 RepID=UPI0034616782
MKILLIAATAFEIAPLLDFLRSEGWEREPLHFQKEALSIEVLITGVGLPLAAFALGHRLTTRQYNLLLQAGVAGAIDRQLQLGEVVEVVSDCFADLGVEEADGTFTEVTTMGLIDGDSFPFKYGRLWNSPIDGEAFLPRVHGISVNKVHGTEESIAAMKASFPFAQVESMEGASFFYASLQYARPALQIRSISNYVEKRQRDNWKLKEAITNLNQVLQEMLLSFSEQ